MNSVQQKTLIMKDEFLKYETVFGLFKILYNICKMLNADKHFEYCYCNLSKNQCWLCSFAKYVRNNHIKNDLLRYREEEDRLLDIAYKFRFFTVKIQNEMKKLEDKEQEEFVLDFFNQKFSFEDVIRNDIIKFNEKYMK